MIGITKHSAESLPVQSALHALRGRFHGLLGQLTQASRTIEHYRVMFVSPEHGNGTTTLAACTALTLIRQLRRDVALVEANLYTPALACYLGIDSGPGLLDVMDGAAVPEAAVRNSKVEGLYAVTAGGDRIPDEGELADDSLGSLVDRVATEHRYTIVDAPPVLEHPEACLLLERVDDVILVVDAATTPRSRAQEAVKLVADAGGRVSGVFLNRYRSDLPFGFERLLG